MKTKKASANTGFVFGRGDLQSWSFVLLINFSNKLKLCAPKPARTQSPKTLEDVLTEKPQINIWI